MYHRPGANELMSFVRDPRRRMDDGVFLGLQHTTRERPSRAPTSPSEIDWYKNADWSWLTAPATAAAARSRPRSPCPRHAVRHVRRARSCSAQRASRWSSRSSVAVAAAAARRTPRATSPARCSSAAPDVGQRPGRPALQQRLGLRGDRLGLAARVRRLALLLLRRAKAPPAGHAVPGRHDLGRLGAVHGPRHADLRAVGEHLPARRRHGAVRRALHPRHGRQEPEHQHRGRRVGVRHRHRRPARGGDRSRAGGPAGAGAAPGRLETATSSTPGSSTKLGAAVSPSKVALSTASDSGSFDVTFSSSVDLDGLEAEGFGLSQPG